jgi:hypothetical protein
VVLRHRNSIHCSVGYKPSKPGSRVTKEKYFIFYLMAGPNCPPSSSPQVSTWYEGGTSMSRASMAEGAWSFIGLELKSSHLGKEYFK